MRTGTLTSPKVTDPVQSARGTLLLWTRGTGAKRQSWMRAISSLRRRTLHATPARRTS